MTRSRLWSIAVLAAVVPVQPAMADDIVLHRASTKLPPPPPLQPVTLGGGPNRVAAARFLRWHVQRGAASALLRIAADRGQAAGGRPRAWRIRYLQHGAERFGSRYAAGPCAAPRRSGRHLRRRQVLRHRSGEHPQGEARPHRRTRNAATIAQGAALYTASTAALRGYDVLVPIDGMSSSDAFGELATAWVFANGPASVSRHVTLTRSDLIGFAPNK